MGLASLSFVTRTTGCPNGCARPYMAEMALVGSGPNMYQLWLGGDPAQGERTAQPTSIFKMKLEELELTMEPIFAIYKVSPNARPHPKPKPKPKPRPNPTNLTPNPSPRPNPRPNPSPSPNPSPNPNPNPSPNPTPNQAERTSKDEAFGTVCHRLGNEKIEAFMETYKPGDYLTMVDPFAPALLPARDATVGIDSALLLSLEAEGRARGLDAATLLDMVLRESLGIDEE